MLREGKEPWNEYRRCSRLGAAGQANKKTSTWGRETGRGLRARRPWTLEEERGCYKGLVNRVEATKKVRKEEL